jgi:spore coat polysaccharide biosynthesis protein SpsF
MATEQESFWAGEFGSNYSRRNEPHDLLPVNLRLLSDALRTVPRVNSILELGANVGANLLALHTLLPQASLEGVEINRDSYLKLQELPFVRAHHGSLIDFDSPRTFDLVLTKGVLIHLDPRVLPTAYERIRNLSRKYVLVAEYYNPSPMEIDYRGHRGKLFKRDFAGEILDQYPDMELRDYGFSYRRAEFGADDITWFLLETRNGGA